MLENLYNKKISEIDPIDSNEIDGSYGTDSVIVKEREDLRKIIEEPCLPACLTLYDKNIYTTYSSANKTDIGGQAGIGINYDSLDENNRQVLERLILEGIIERPELSNIPQDRGGRDFNIQVPIETDDTVGKISDRFMQIVSQFQTQDVLYGRYSVDSILNSLGNMYFSDEVVELEWEEYLSLVKSIFPNYVYDEELNIFWATQDLYNKHKKFQEKDLEHAKEKVDKDNKTIDN